MCTVCGDPVDPDDTGPVVIEYYNLTSEYTEEYGFCAEHSPDENESDTVKQRIKAGLDQTR